MEVLNMRRPHKHAIRLCPTGEINLRKKIINLLDLNVGDKVIFCLNDKQMYLYKDNDDNRALRLTGRRQQLTAHSVDTVRSILTSVDGITPELRRVPVELVAFNWLVSITIDGVSHNAVKIINRI